MHRASKLVFLTIIIFFPFFVLAKDYPDGTLIRAKGDQKVYLIQGHKKSWIKSLEDFKAKKLNWKKVKTVSLKEFDAIEENVSNSPTPTSAITPLPPTNLVNSSLPSPSFSLPLSPVVTPIPAKINLGLPPPDNVRVEWLTSQVTANYGRIGQRITFRYSSKEADKIENYRLYEKKPGALYFSKVADFAQIKSNSCEGISVNGEWMMTEAATNQCGYWAMQRVTPPGGRGMVAYLPAASYSEGEYSYYVAGVDGSGLETPPSPEAKLIFLATIDISSPVDRQPVTDIFPTFKWTIASGWPAGIIADYYAMFSDNPSAQSPVWTKFIKVAAGKSEQLVTYDGFSLNPAKKYQTFIYGHYRKSETDPDYISIPSAVPEFWMDPERGREGSQRASALYGMKSSSQPVSLLQFLKALFFRAFAF